MILGLRTCIYPAPELARAKAWYAEAFGVAPYFDEPFYVGFRIGGFELGLVPDATPGRDGAQALWGVTDIDETDRASRHARRDLDRCRHRGRRRHPRRGGRATRSAIGSA